MSDTRNAARSEGASDLAERSFPKGHVATLRHGAHSPRVYLSLARELAAGLVIDRPDLERFPEAVEAWAQAEAQATILRGHLAKNGSIDPTTNEPRASGLHWLRQFERLAMQQRAVLGLDPLGEARLAKERASASVLAADLQGIADRGAAVLQARRDAGEPEPLDRPAEILAEVIAAAPVYKTPLKSERQKASDGH